MLYTPISKGRSQLLAVHFATPDNSWHGTLKTLRYQQYGKKGLPEDQSLWIKMLIEAMNWPHNPTATYMGVWPESDPIGFRQANHRALLDEINRSLPESVALIGSDAIRTSAPPCLDERIGQGIAAAQRIAATIN